MPFKSVGDEELESLLNKATSPSNVEENWEAIMGFCDQVNKELEGAQIAVKLLAHKIQSPQEKEALYALTVTESCVRNCGKVFHQEIGKFKFLNELIKVVSPKYLGMISSERVKKRCIELLYSWSKGLTHEPKFGEAYGMLKRQGIVRQDPIYIENTVQRDQELHRLSQVPIPPAPEDSIFKDSEKSKTLSRLLKSRNPEDLIAANRLIKTMVKEENDRIEKISKRMSDLETVKNNCKLLSDMLKHYSRDNSLSDLEIMSELFRNIEQARPSLFRMASETDNSDGGESIQEILLVNDNASDVLKRYRELVDVVSSSSSGSPEKKSQLNDVNVGVTGNFSNLSLLEDLGFSASAASQSHMTDALPPAYSKVAQESSLMAMASNTASLVDMQLAEMGLDDTNLARNASAAKHKDVDLLHDLMSTPIPPAQPHKAVRQPSKPIIESGEKKEAAAIKGFEEIDMLGQRLLQESKSSGFGKKRPAVNPPPAAPLVAAAVENSASVNEKEPFDTPLLLIECEKSKESTLLRTDIPKAASTSCLEEIPPCDLKALHVELSSVVPHPSRQPITLSNTDGLNVSLHFTRDRPHPSVQVYVITITSHSQHSIKQLTFQAVVSKAMKVKVQAATTTELAPSSPFLPPSAASQIMLVENSCGETVHLKFRLTAVRDDDLMSVDGQVEIEPDST